jgi:hypothetical protein
MPVVWSQAGSGGGGLPPGRGGGGRRPCPVGLHRSQDAAGVLPPSPRALGRAVSGGLSDREGADGGGGGREGLPAGDGVGGPDLRGPGELPSPCARAGDPGRMDGLGGVDPGPLRGRGSGGRAVPPQGPDNAPGQGAAPPGADRSAHVVEAERLLRAQPRAGPRGGWSGARGVGPLHDVLSDQLSRLRFTPGSPEVVYLHEGGHDELDAGEGERVDAMEFVARVLVQIPGPRRHSARYYGFYSNAARGKRRKAAAPAETSSSSEPERETTTPPDGADRAALRRRSGGNASPRVRSRPPGLPPLWRRDARGRVHHRARRDQAHPGSPPQARQALTLSPSASSTAGGCPRLIGHPITRWDKRKRRCPSQRCRVLSKRGPAPADLPCPSPPSAGGVPDPSRTGERGLLLSSRRCAAAGPRKATPYPSTPSRSRGQCAC